MAIYTQRNALNLVPGESAQLVVHLSHGAAGVAVEFYLYNGGVPYEPEGAAIAVHGVRKDGTGFGPVACSYIGNVVTFETTEEMAAIAGPALAELTITDENGDTTGTANFAMLIEEGTFPEGPAYDTDISVYQQILAYCQSFPASVDGHAETLVNAEAATRAAADTALAQNITNAVSAEATARAAADTNLQTQISGLQNAVGGPNVALTAADFTDITKVYVVAGTIAGMTTGDWYYWDGTAWVSGGVYNSTAVQTDPTLSVPGMAADAASCGDLKSALGAITGCEKILFSAGHIVTNGATVDPTAVVVVANNFKHAVVDCQEGDVFTISGTGASTPRLWCFINSNETNNVVAVSGESVAENGLVLVAPTGSSKLIINDNSGKSSYIGRLIDDRFGIVNANISGITERTNQLFDINSSVVYDGFLSSGALKISYSSAVKTVSIPVKYSAAHTKVHVHKDFVTSRFIVATSNVENANIGCPLTTVIQDDGAKDITIDLSASTKTVCVLFWHTDTSYDADEVLQTLMVQYGEEYTGYESYIVPKGYGVYSKLLLERQNLLLGWQKDYMLNIGFEADKYITDKTHTSIFITDTHINDITPVRFIATASAMSKYVNCKYIVHGGDIIDGITAPNNELLLLSEVNRFFLESNCSTLYCKGNHDDNKIYARGGSRTGPIGDFDDYILNMDLYKRTNAFVKSGIVWGSKENMYGFYDDEETKIRSIIINEFDNPETEDENGKRVEDSNTQRIQLDQWEWLCNVALRFADKEDPSEWAVIFYAHDVYIDSRWFVVGLACAFKAGSIYERGNAEALPIYTADFTDQGPMEVIAVITGDVHYDALIKKSFSGYYNDASVPVIRVLNASLSRDNTNLPTPTNGILMPPKKTLGTENETAYDIITINREDKLIYLTRYGARSYAYNDVTDDFDVLVNRTRIINYDTCEYERLI